MKTLHVFLAAAFLFASLGLFPISTAEASPGSACRSNAERCYSHAQCMRTGHDAVLCGKHYTRLNPRRDRRAPIAKTAPTPPPKTEK